MKQSHRLDLTFSFWVADNYLLPYCTVVPLCWLFLQQLTQENCLCKREVINTNAMQLSYRPAARTQQAHGATAACRHRIRYLPLPVGLLPLQVRGG